MTITQSMLTASMPGYPAYLGNSCQVTIRSDPWVCSCIIKCRHCCLRI